MTSLSSPGACPVLEPSKFHFGSCDGLVMGPFTVCERTNKLETDIETGGINGSGHFSHVLYGYLYGKYLFARSRPLFSVKLDYVRMSVFHHCRKETVERTIVASLRRRRTLALLRKSIPLPPILSPKGDRAGIKAANAKLGRDYR